eukprot:1865785-Karenia_brevis.AAC.1
MKKSTIETILRIIIELSLRNKLQQVSSEDDKPRKVWNDNLGRADSMQRRVSVCVSVYRTPSEESFRKREKSDEPELQEKHQTGEEFSGRRPTHDF